MERNWITESLNNRRFDRLLDFITDRLGLNTAEVAGLLGAQKEELERYAGRPVNDRLETRLAVLAEFARLGFDGKLRAWAEALLDGENAAAFSKLCGVDGATLADPKNSASAEEKYRLAVGLGLLASLRRPDTGVETAKNTSKKPEL